MEVRKDVRSLMPREGDAAVPIEAVLRSVQVVRSIVFGGDSSVSFPALLSLRHSAVSDGFFLPVFLCAPCKHAPSPPLPSHLCSSSPLRGHSPPRSGNPLRTYIVNFPGRDSNYCNFKVMFVIVHSAPAEFCCSRLKCCSFTTPSLSRSVTSLPRVELYLCCGGVVP